MEIIDQAAEKKEIEDAKSSSSSHGSAPMDIDLVFPTKPESSKKGREVQLYSNFYKIECKTGGRDVLFEYQVKTAPLLTCHTMEEKMKLQRIVRKLKDKLEAQFENHVYWEGFIYSFEKIDDDELLANVSYEEDGVSYLVDISLHDSLSFSNPKVSRFFRAYLNQLIKRSNLQLVRGGKHFDPNKPMNLEGVSMYPAYFNTMKCIDGNIYLNLNPSVKFFQTQRLSDMIYEMNDEDRVKSELTGRSVMTLYNHRVYKIDEVDFTKNPEKTFCITRNGEQEEISYATYIKRNYKQDTEYMDQPLFRNHNLRTGQDVYLIPEHCVLTGITEQQKGRNFKAIRPEMFADAKMKNKQTKRFFETLRNNEEKYKEFTEKWKIKVNEKEMPIKATQCSFGTIVGGGKATFSLKNMKRDFSRAFSAPLKSQKIENWAVFYSPYSSKEYGDFMKALKQTVSEDFEYK